MKKLVNLLAILLTLASCFSLVACGDDDDTTSPGGVAGGGTGTSGSPTAGQPTAGNAGSGGVR